MTQRPSLTCCMRIVLVAIWLFVHLPALAMTINSAVMVGSQLTITGTGFSGTPISVIFNGSQATVDSSSTTQIVVTINPLPPPGTYRVVVKAGKTASLAYVTLSNVVTKVSILNQSSAIPLTTLWTPASDGLYRVSIYMVQVPPFPGGSEANGFVTANFEWTDDA